MAVALTLAPAPADAGVVLRDGRPVDGLAWRLHLPADASASAPAPLIVWLHPAGGRSFNAEVEALVPVMARAGFALLVPVDKNYESWTGEDALRLLRGTLPDLARVPEVNAARPILFGFSGGGQLALELFHALPHTFAGLILDAAYPVVEGPDGARPRPEPPGAAARGARVFAAVGADDPVAGVWDTLAAGWRERGIELTILRVPDRGHQWLFGERAVIDAFTAWLTPASSAPPPAPPVAPAEPKPPEPVR